MRAIGIRGVRVSGDVSLPAAKVTSDVFRERSNPLKQSPGAGDATNKAPCRPLFALKQSACLAVELEMLHGRPGDAGTGESVSAVSA